MATTTSKTQDEVLVILCAQTEARGGAEEAFMLDEVADQASARGIDNAALRQAVRMLAYSGYIRTEDYVGEAMVIQVTPTGYYQYARAAIPSFSKIVADVERVIVTSRSNNRETAEAVRQPQVLVDYVYLALKEAGQIRTADAAAGGWWMDVMEVSPALEMKYANS